MFHKASSFLKRKQFCNNRYQKSFTKNRFYSDKVAKFIKTSRKVFRHKYSVLAIFGSFYITYKFYKNGISEVNVYPESIESEYSIEIDDTMIVPETLDDLYLSELSEKEKEQFNVELKIRLFLNTLISYVKAFRVYFSDDFDKNKLEKEEYLKTPFPLHDESKAFEHSGSDKMTKIYASGSLPTDSSTTILPPSSYGKHLTLVIDVDLFYGIVSDEKHGFVLRKRPFTDNILKNLSEHCEIILVSTTHNKGAAKRLFHLFDPFHISAYYLTKEDMIKKGRRIYKPLEEQLLGRDPSRLAVLDLNYDTCGSMCDNVLRIKPWKGKASDTTLFDIIPLLTYMSISAKEGKDIREIIKRYDGHKSSRKTILSQVRYMEPFPDDDSRNLKAITLEE